MTWIDVITTGELLVLCVIAYRMYRVKQAIEDMYSGLGQLLEQNREITKKILFQLDSGGAVPAASPRYPLHVVVHTIQEDLRSFTNRWAKLHTSDLVRIEMEEREVRKQIRRAIREREEQERKAKTKDGPENGDT